MVEASFTNNVANVEQVRACDRSSASGSKIWLLRWLVRQIIHGFHSEIAVQFNGGLPFDAMQIQQLCRLSCDYKI